MQSEFSHYNFIHKSLFISNFRPLGLYQETISLKQVLEKKL